MNTFFTILLVIGVLLVLLILLALLLPKSYSVTVSEIINVSKEEVYKFISLFNCQTQYSEWLKGDSTLKPRVIGTDGEVGAILEWISTNPDKKKNVGKGEQEIISMDENTIEVQLRLLEPMPATCQLIHVFETIENKKTRYTCTFSARAKFPINLPAYLIGRRFIRKTQQKTLKNVKNIIEKKKFN